MTLGEVVEQFSVLWTHVAGPYDLGMVNIGGVVYPLMIDIMVDAVGGSVAHDDQMLSRHLFEAFDDAGSIEIAAGPCWFDGSVTRRRCKPHGNHSDRNHAHDMNECPSGVLAAGLPEPQMPHTLNQQDVQQPGCGREIVGEHPSFNRS